MQEAIPRKIKPPQTEPELRVGIVLEEDLKQELTFEVLADYELSDLNLELKAHQRISISKSGTSLLVNQKAINKSSLKLTSKNQNSTIKFYNIIAGRTFHWKKEITVTLPGSFEIHISNDNLILVNILPFEQYLLSVVTSEMGTSCPIHFLMAQAICARSWSFVFLTNKHQNKYYTICNDDCCQRYQGFTHLDPKITSEFKQCAGEFLVDSSGDTIAAYYSKCCGGISELPKTVFNLDLSAFDSISDSLEQIPAANTNASFSDFLKINNNCFCSEDTFPVNLYQKYLGAVDQTEHYFRWQKAIPSYEIIELLKELDPQITELDKFEILERGPSGRIIKLKIEYSRLDSKHTLVLNSQYNIRKYLSKKFLFSSAFEFDSASNLKGNIILNGAGWGHGVGLCQMGGVGMALKNFHYQAILRHYFPQAKLVKVY